jgi:hypothetical protein
MIMITMMKKTKPMKKMELKLVKLILMLMILISKISKEFTLVKILIGNTSVQIQEHISSIMTCVRD